MVVCSEAGDEMAVSSKARDEAVPCSGAKIEDYRRWAWGLKFYAMGT
jgi:hypothetical protein